MEFFYIAVLAVLSVMGGLAVARYSRETREAKAAAHESIDIARQAESDITALRLAKFEIERRLAVEEQKTARIPEFEKALTVADSRIELSRLAKVAAESQAAVARESIVRLEAALAEAREREAEADRVHAGLQEHIDALKGHISQMEPSMAARAEVMAQHEQAAADLRDRLSAAEAARDQAASRMEGSIQARTGLEATLARASTQLQEKTQRLEALEAELQQTRGGFGGRMEAAIEAKSTLEANLATAAGQIEEKTRRIEALEAEREQSRGESAGRLEAALAAKSALEAGLAGATAQVQDRTRRLEGLERQLEQARGEAASRLAAAAEAKAALEAGFAGATAQVQEKTRRLEALEEQLDQARGEVASRMAAAAEARAALEASLAGASAQAEEKTRRLEALEGELQGLRGDFARRLDSAAQAKSALEANLAGASAQLREKAQRLEALAGEVAQARGESESARLALGGQNERLAALQEALEQERRYGVEKLAIIAGAREQMTQEFRALAEEVIRRHSQDLGQHNKAQIETVLVPLRERLSEFQQGLAHAYDESAKERAALADQIRKLSANSTQMASETQQLAALLKGKAEGLGAWGEVLLSSILDRSGLREGEDYVFRESYSPDGSQRLRPDVVISLPGDQRVLIDSKVPLIAFEAYVNAKNEADSALHLASHAAAMSGHIRDLAERGPPPVAESRRDYTVMFVPVEGALAAALRQDPDLTGLAVENNIALATPGTLMMALRSVANVWQAERRNQRAEAIAERAGKLYDSFAAYLGDMELLGDHLVRARHAYEEALGRLSSGRDNLIGQVEELRDMGAKPSTVLPRISAGERRFENALDGLSEGRREAPPGN